MTVKVVIADDHGLVRQSLRQYLEMEPDIEVVGEASRGSEVIDILERADPGSMPDVVILDTRMPETDGLEAARRIHAEHAKIGIVMLSAYDDPQFVVAALRSGAMAYVLKNKDVEYLVQAVRLVAEGRIVIDPDIAPALAEGLSPGRDAPKRSDTLTQREMEVLQLLAFGNTNREAAERLSISPETVKATSSTSSRSSRSPIVPPRWPPRFAGALSTDSIGNPDVAGETPRDWSDRPRSPERHDEIEFPCPAGPR